jgi:hypothetical protein
MSAGWVGALAGEVKLPGALLRQEPANDQSLESQ